ncbi:DUF3307 domain-containing protein [Streptomyces sp. NPDC057539]|uniref:DUF3307 domain-containing protein n=1 Tax=Streptomyces sp. NPDC057539 TaxID=3346159 RepID=UPI00369C3487
MFASLFILLFIAHLLSDYALQTDHQAEHKALRTWKGYKALAVHAGTHVAVSAVLLGLGGLLLGLSLTPLVALAALLWIGGSHAFVDRRWPVTWWMTHTGSEEWIGRGGAAHVDQTAHVAALGIAAMVMAAL